MNTDRLFYESIDDAVRTVVQSLGGTKKVGPMLWPALGPSAASRRLIDCLNESRPEKLSPGELLKLARWGREAGCHAIAVYFNGETGYAPPVPVNADDEKQDLQRKFIDAVGYLAKINDRLEQLKTL